MRLEGAAHQPASEHRLPNGELRAAAITTVDVDVLHQVHLAAEHLVRAKPA